MNHKPDKIAWIREILITQLNHWMLFPVYVASVAIFNSASMQSSSFASQVVIWLISGLVPFLFCLGRICFRDLRMMTVLYIGILFAMIFMPVSHPSLRVLHGFVGIAYILASSYILKHKQNKLDNVLYPYIGVGAFVLALPILHALDITMWDRFLVNLLITTLVLYFVIYYVEQYTTFLDDNKGSAGIIGAKEMLRSGLRPVGLFAIVCLPLFFLVSNIRWLGDMLSSLLSSIRRFFNMLFSFMMYKTHAPAEATSDFTLMDVVEQFRSTEPVETATIWVWLEKIIVALVVIFIVFAAIKLLIFLFRLLRNKLANILPEKPTVMAEANISDVREKCEIVQERKSEGLFSFLSQDPKKKIRQLYKKKILASEKFQSNLLGTADQDLKLCTARESAKILEREQMGLLYEKARYSNADCNSDDVKQMKNACR